MSLLDVYLSSEELDIKDVVGMSVDMILAGVDTVIIKQYVSFRIPFTVLKFK